MPVIIRTAQSVELNMLLSVPSLVTQSLKRRMRLLLSVYPFNIKNKNVAFNLDRVLTCKLQRRN